MSWRFYWQKWLDEFVLAGKGILLATKEKRFWYGFVPAFFFFGFLNKDSNHSIQHPSGVLPGG